MTTVRVQCAWCLKQMGTKEFKEHGKDNSLMVSHSICSSCYSEVMSDVYSKRRRKPNPFRNKMLFYHSSE